MTHQPRPIALFDMQAQQALIRPELDRRVAHVLSSGRFINGPEVAELEAAGEAVSRIGEIVEGQRGCTVRGSAETWGGRSDWQAQHLA